jgi:hypothetical protein
MRHLSIEVNAPQEAAQHLRLFVVQPTPMPCLRSAVDAEGENVDAEE